MAPVKPQLVSISDHPRAAGSIRRIKAWSGLAGFAAVGGYGYADGTPIDDCLLHALAAGILFVFLGWIGAIVVWQHLLDAEATIAARRAGELRRARIERARRASTENGGN